MKSTKSLIKAIQPRMKNLRDHQIDILWNDLLTSLEKAFNAATDEQLKRSFQLTIIYYEGKNQQFFRRCYAELSYFDDNNENMIQFDENDFLIGDSTEMDVVLKEFFIRVDNDDYLSTPDEYEYGIDEMKVDFLIDSTC